MIKISIIIIILVIINVYALFCLFRRLLHISIAEVIHLIINIVLVGLLERIVHNLSFNLTVVAVAPKLLYSVVVGLRGLKKETQRKNSKCP